MGFLSRTGAEIGYWLEKNAKKSFFIIENIKKYRKCPALLTNQHNLCPVTIKGAGLAADLHAPPVLDDDVVGRQPDEVGGVGAEDDPPAVGDQHGEEPRCLAVHKEGVAWHDKAGVGREGGWPDRALGGPVVDPVVVGAGGGGGGGGEGQVEDEKDEEGLDGLGHSPAHYLRPVPEAGS